MRFLFVDLCAQFVPFFSHLAQQLREQGAEVWFAGVEDARAHLLLKKRREPILFSRNLRLRHTSPLSQGQLEESIFEHWDVNRTGVEDDYFRRHLIKHAERASGTLDFLLERHEIDAVVVWNGLTGTGRLAVELARRRKLNVWFFENGFFPWTLQCDSRGVNFQNSLTTLPEKYFDDVPLDSERFQQFTQNLLHGNIPEFPYHADAPKASAKGLSLNILKLRRAQFLEWLPHWRHHWKLRKSLNAVPERRAIGDAQFPIREPYVFVPLQVNKDTQIRSYSPHVADMHGFVEVVHKAWRSLNQDKLRLVVKEHPAETSRMDYESLKQRFRDIIWVEAGPTQEWLAGAEVVVTINSGAGVEALAHGRPVVTLGKAFYNKEDIVFHCDEPSQLNSKLEAALKHPHNSKYIQKFIYFLRFQYLIEGSWRAWSRGTVETTARRLLKIDKSPSEPGRH